MDNKQIYRKTLGFSLRRVLWDFLSLVILAAFIAGGFLIAEKVADNGLVGLVIGLVLGLIVLGVVMRYISYTFKAGQIAMMTRGIVDGELPNDVYAEGKRTVKERFLTIAAFYAVTRVIKGIFNQIGQALTNLGRSVGGKNGNAVASAISAVIQVVVAYLCDCCLGWVFYRKGVNAARATCEGAVLFFKHGKTLAKNMGRVFGMGLVSLLAIGGVFSGIFYTITSRFPAAFQVLAAEISEVAAASENEIPAILTDPQALMVVAAIIGGIIVWRIIHSVFIRPFVLTGVLRNYIESGIKEMPRESEFSALDSKSSKFRKLHGQLA